VPPLDRLVAADRARPSLKLPIRLADAALGWSACPSAKLPIRLAETLRGEPSAPSPNEPTRNDEGTSGVRSMPSLKRRARGAALARWSVRVSR
jgi:hypothetical protein